jgi:hypothetical protein
MRYDNPAAQEVAYQIRRTPAPVREAAAYGRRAGSCDEDLLAVPVEVLAGSLSAGRQQQRLPQRKPPVVLPGELVARGGPSQRAGNVDAQPGVEGHIVGRARRQAIARSRCSLGVLSFHGLMFPASSIRRAMARHFCQTPGLPCPGIYKLPDLGTRRSVISSLLTPRVRLITHGETGRTASAASSPAAYRA